MRAKRPDVTKLPPARGNATSVFPPVCALFAPSRRRNSHDDRECQHRHDETDDGDRKPRDQTEPTAVRFHVVGVRFETCNETTRPNVVDVAMSDDASRHVPATNK